MSINHDIHEDFVRAISTRLSGALPGLQAQGRMAPATHPSRNLPHDLSTARPSSVLILLFPLLEGGTGTVFIRRTPYAGIHGGQISLPGGKPEPGDTDLAATATRECQEEIGIEASDIEVIGSLSPLYIPPSRFLVTPFVGTLPYSPTFIADTSEVAEIIAVELALLTNPACLNTLAMEYIGVGNIHVPCYSLNGMDIWGATAMILSEFIEIITS